MSQSSGRLPEEALELFGLPLDEFTRRKSELAKRLKAAGDKEASAAVTALRKPSVAIWALNQVARRHREEIEELIRALEALSAPKSRNEMRMASQKRGRTVAAITELAVRILEQHGHGGGAATANKITQTLLAVGTDEEVRAALAEGRLVDDYASADAGGDIWSLSAPAGDPGPDPQPRKDTEAQKRREALEEAIERLGGAAEIARREAKEAEVVAREARRKAEKAEAAAEGARKRADRAKTALERKQKELSQNLRPA